MVPRGGHMRDGQRRRNATSDDPAKGSPLGVLSVTKPRDFLCTTSPAPKRGGLRRSSEPAEACAAAHHSRRTTCRRAEELTRHRRFPRVVAELPAGVLLHAGRQLSTSARAHESENKTELDSPHLRTEGDADDRRTREKWAGAPSTAHTKGQNLEAVTESQRRREPSAQPWRSSTPLRRRAC